MKVEYDYTSPVAKRELLEEESIDEQMPSLPSIDLNYLSV